jgi:hypothetical protein
MGSAHIRAVGKLPADDVGPLIPSEWKIAMAVDLVGKVLVHSCFTCGADSNRFLQLALPSVCYPCYLCGKAVDMILLPIFKLVNCLISKEGSHSLLEIVTRNEQRVVAYKY